MRRLFIVLYILFIIISIVYPFKILTGPVTIRHIYSIFMLGLCIYEGFRSDKYLNLYYVFLLFFFLSSLGSGFALEFVNKLFGTYLPMIVAYISTYLLVKKYNGAKVLVWLFVGIGVINALVTIGQFFHLAIVDDVFAILQIDADEEFLDLSERRASLEGFAIPGLFGTVVNGYFLSVSALLVLYNYYCNRIINIGIWALVMFASLLAQERSGFFLAIVLSCFIFVKFFLSKGHTIGVIVSVLFFVLICYLSMTYIDALLLSDLRYLRGFDDQGRGELRRAAWDYILSNPFGGAFDYGASGNRVPHNFFMNALLCGGLIGGISIIYLLFIQIKKILPYLHHLPKATNAQGAFIWGLMYIDYTLNSMMHNASMASGSFLFFVWWAAFLAMSNADLSLLKKKQQKRII